MVNKEIFKTEITNLFEVHCCKEKATVEMLKLWYEECKELDEEEFRIATNRARYADTEPKLYHILINLPDYDKVKHKSISDYLGKIKNKSTSTMYQYLE